MGTGTVLKQIMINGNITFILYTHSDDCQFILEYMTGPNQIQIGPMNIRIIRTASGGLTFHIP